MAEAVVLKHGLPELGLAFYEDASLAARSADEWRDVAVSLQVSWEQSWRGFVDQARYGEGGPPTLGRIARSGRERFGEDPEALYDVAQLMFAAGDYQAALDLAERSENHELATWIHLARAEPQRAFEAFKRAWMSEDESLLVAGRLALLAGAPEKALELFDAAAVDSWAPVYPHALAGTVRAWIALGDSAAARESLATLRAWEAYQAIPDELGEEALSTRLEQIVHKQGR